MMKKTVGGFTLIEIIVIIGVISILMNIGLAYYNKFNEQKKLQSDTQKLYDILHLARAKTISGDQMNITCTSFSGYQVEIVSSSSYKLVLCCSDACSGADQTEIQTYSLQSSITLDPAPATIKFKKLTGEVVTSTDIEISNSVISECMKLSVKQSGLVELITSCP